MIVVRLPDSPTEYGQRSVSPQTTSTWDNGTPSASAAIIPIVVLAPPPTSVTPTCTAYRSFAFTLDHRTAAAEPRPEHQKRHAGAALDRVHGPIRAADASASSTRTPRPRGGCTPRACRWCTASRSPAFRVMFFRMNSTGSIFSLAATSSIIDWMPKKPWGNSGPRKLPDTVLFVYTGRHGGLDVRALIQLDAADRAGVLAIGAHAAVAAQLNGLERAVARHADLVVLDGRPPPVHADEILLARQLELDGRRRLSGQHRRNQIGVLILVLVAEVAAHVLADDADVFLREAEVAGHVGAAVGDAAGRRVDRQLVARPVRDRRARLHLRVVLERGRVAILEHVIRGREAVLHVAPARAERLDLVPRVRRQVAFGPDLHRAGRERFLRIEDKRQRLVLHRDQEERFFRDVTIDRRDRRHRFADEADRVVEGVAAMDGDLLHVLVVLLAARDGPRAPDEAAVLVRDDGLHAGKRERLRRVDAADPGVRVRAPQHPRVQHAGQRHVAGVDRLPGDALDRVDAGRRMSYDIQRRNRGTRRGCLSLRVAWSFERDRCVDRRWEAATVAAT